MLAAAEAAGIATWCSQTATEYARTRQQFGRPIGSFQAIKHLCAQLLCRAELATAAAWDAACAADQAPDELTLAAAAAGALALDAAVDNAKDCIQVLGGIGFTWEHDAHLYLRRALALRSLLGGSAIWRARAAGLALGGRRRHPFDGAKTSGDNEPSDADQVRAAARVVASAVSATPRDHWRDGLAEIGYAAPAWPPPYGLSAGPAAQMIIDEELARAGIERPDLGIGGWAIPAILNHGTAAQLDRFAGPTLSGEIVWCQLFSEPEAGSDLASLRTRAVRADGGGWRLTGQKVWTSLADEADWAICLARTDPSAPKHKGITYFLVSMHDPGIEVRPLREITGRAMFNEVFLDDVFVPDDCVVGEPGEGWRVARTTLATERVAMVRGAGLGEDAEELLTAAAARRSRGSHRDRPDRRAAGREPGAVGHGRPARRCGGQRRAGQPDGSGAQADRGGAPAGGRRDGGGAGRRSGRRGRRGRGRRRGQLPADQMPVHRGRHEPDPAVAGGRTGARAAQGGDALMDFELDEAQRVIAASAAEVLGSAALWYPEPGSAGSAASGEEPDLTAWQALAKAGLLALTLPGWMGGDDLGPVEAAVLLTEVGRQAAQVPALATIMLGALPVVRWGGRELAERVLAGVGSGETILTAGVRERTTGMPADPATVAVLDATGSGTVTGTKIGVPFAGQARWMLVPAAIAGGGRAVVVVDLAGQGVSVARTPASAGAPEYTVRLDAAPAAGVLGTGDREAAAGAGGASTGAADGRAAAVDDLYLLAAAGAAAMADGAVAGALDLTARYVATREQFGRPLATFQAVAGQAADVYITSRTLHLAALSAVLAPVGRARC